MNESKRKPHESDRRVALERVAEAAPSALVCLTELNKYGEAMRQFGRGFHPTGAHGEPSQAAEAALRFALAALAALDA